MPVIHAADAPTFTLPDLTVTGLAAPSRGSAETCVWQLRLAPGAAGTRHTVDREEIFVIVAGAARATVGDAVHELGVGDALIVPAASAFALANPGDEPLVAIATLPVGGRATLPGGAPFAPPWTL